MKFGDIIENGWASLDNPERIGVYVETIRRTGRLNPGTHYRCTDMKGGFWELPKSDKLHVIGNALIDDVWQEGKYRKDTK